MIMDGNKLSTLGIVGGITAVVAFALAAVLFIQPGEESAQRLGLFFGMVGVVITTLVGMLRSDQAAKQTNGSLDARIQANVHRALGQRKADLGLNANGDPAPTATPPFIDPEPYDHTPTR